MNEVEMTNPQLLELIYLTDSALPIGAAAHSFGLESLVANGLLSVDQLEVFLNDYLAEAGLIEAAFCRAAHQLASSEFELEDWLLLNQRLSALKPARESRNASTTLGRRFLQLINTLSPAPLFQSTLDVMRPASVDEAATGEAHYATSFGVTGGVLGFAESITALAFVRQSIAGMVSACQRLLPLGQSEAARIQWNLKAAMIDCVGKSEAGIDLVFSFTPLLEIGSLRHPALATRLFIS